MKPRWCFSLTTAKAMAQEAADDTGIPQHVLKTPPTFEVTDDPARCTDANYVDTLLPGAPCDECHDPAFDGGEFCCARCARCDDYHDMVMSLPAPALAKWFKDNEGYDPNEDADSELVGNPPEEPSTVTPTHGSSPGTDDEPTGRCHWCGEPCEPGGGFAECDDFCVACGEMYGRPEKT